MPDLLTRPLLRASERSAGTRGAWFAATLAAVWALAASLALLGVSALVIWLAEGARAPLGAPMRIGGQIWLVAHRVGLELEAGRLTLAPLGLTLPVVLLLYRAGRWASHVADVRDFRDSLVVVGSGAGVYGFGGILVAILAADANVRALPLQAGAGCAAVAIVGLGAGTIRGSGSGGILARRLPAAVHPSLVAAAASTAVLVAGGSALVTWSLLGHADRVTGLARTIEAGLLGGVMVALVGAVLLPNTVIWAASFALGPGFAVGAGTIVSPGEVQLGAVPALPLLAALPVDVPGSVGRLTLLVPLAAGVVAGWLVHRQTGDVRAYLVPLHGLGAGALTGALVGAAALLSGGSVGGNRLSVVGPAAGQVMWAAALEVGLTAAVVALLLRWTAGGLRIAWWAPGERRQGSSKGEEKAAPTVGDAAVGGITQSSQTTTDAMQGRRHVRVKDGRSLRLRGR